MFCTESCEHGINASGGQGRVYHPSRLAGGIPQEPGQLWQMGQPNQMQARVCAPPAQPQCSNMGCILTLPPPNFCLSSYQEQSHLGMCFVTERPDGLSIDCSVPIPNNFNWSEYQRQMMMSPLAPPGMGYGMPLTHFDCPASGFPSQNLSAFQSMSKPKPKFCINNLCCESQPEQLQQQQQQEQQLGIETCMDMSSAVDNQLVASLMCLVEILRAKRSACCSNQNTQPGQSGVPMGDIGLVPIELPILGQKDSEPSTAPIASSPRLSTSTLPRDSSVKTASTARTPRRSTYSTRQPFECKPQCRPSCTAPKNSNLAQEATQLAQNHVQTQTTFMSCPMSYPRHNLVWHRPCFPHSYRYP